MTDSRPVQLASLRDAIEASTLVSFLESHGIHAELVGEFTSNFQVEIDSDAKVVVKENDIERARDLLARWEEERAAIDWSNVDTGDDSPVEDDEETFDGDRYERWMANSPFMKFMSDVCALISW